MRGTANLFKGERKRKAPEPHSCQERKRDCPEIDECGRERRRRREKKPGDISKKREPFLSPRFKWKLSQVKHKVNQMNLMPRVLQSAAVTRRRRKLGKG